jgi:hypothetical protein
MKTLRGRPAHSPGAARAIPRFEVLHDAASFDRLAGRCRQHAARQRRDPAGPEEHLERAFGLTSRERNWTILEGLFAELGYRDYLGAFQRYRDGHPRELGLRVGVLLPPGLSFGRPAVPGRPRGAEAAPQPRPDRHLVGRRCRLPATQGRARGYVRRHRRACADLTSVWKRQCMTPSGATQRSCRGSGGNLKRWRRFRRPC